MTEWISIKEWLPEVGQDVWVRRSKQNGQPYPYGPIFAGFYGLIPSGNDVVPYFCYKFGCWGSVEYCLKIGVTHWTPRINDIPPEWEMTMPPDTPVQHETYYQRHKEKLKAYQREYYRKCKDAPAAALLDNG